jgi:pimeloyl-ACP methyl ester carboxylesterase
MKVDFADKLIGGFNYEFVRGVSAAGAGMAELGECFETMNYVRKDHFESWIEHWGATADRVSAFAMQQLNAGDRLSAKNAFLRASNYYRMAVFYVAHGDPRHTALWKRSKECFQKMIPLLNRSIECIEIEFEGARLPGYFISAGEALRPTLIALGGFDSTMEEVYGWIGTVAAEYGWHCLIFEGPGQWGALKANPGLIFRADYEEPMSAVVDYLLTRRDVDADRLALIGYSAGGYLAPRAASGEPRVKACICNTLVVDCGEAARAALGSLRHYPQLLDMMFSLAMKLRPALRWGFQHSQWTLGIEKPHEWPEAYKDFTLRGREDRLRNPMLFLFGEDDIMSFAASTRAIVVGLLDFILSLPCESSVHVFSPAEGASSHCQMGGLSYAHGVIFEWLNETLCGAKRLDRACQSERDAFAAIFAKHGGRRAAEKARKLLDVARLI